MKKVFAIVLSLAMVLSLAACGSKQQAASPTDPVQTETQTPVETKVLKMGHMRPEGSFLDLNCKEFAEKIYEGTEGRYQIELYGANQLGDYEVVYERVSMGEIDMYLGSMAKSVDPSLAITSVPGLLTSWDAVQKYLNTTDGTIALYAKERLDLQNLVLLGNHPMYFGVIALSKEPVNWQNPGEPQGLHVRVPSANLGLNLEGEYFGYTTSGLPSSEDFTNMQTGVTDGTIGGGAERTWSDLKDVTKYIIPCNTHFETQWLTINKDLWNSISAEDQAVFEKAAKEMEAKAFEIGPNNTDSYLKQFEEIGVTVYDMTGVQEKYDQIIREKVLPGVRDNLGDAISVFDQVASELSAS